MRTLLAGVLTCLLGLAASGMGLRAYASKHFLPRQHMNEALAAGDGCVLLLGDSRMEAAFDATAFHRGLRIGHADRCIAALPVRVPTEMPGHFFTAREYLAHGEESLVAVLGVAGDSILGPEAPAAPAAARGQQRDPLRVDDARGRVRRGARVPVRERRRVRRRVPLPRRSGDGVRALPVADRRQDPGADRTAHGPRPDRAKPLRRVRRHDRARGGLRCARPSASRRRCVAPRARASARGFRTSRNCSSSTVCASWWSSCRCAGSTATRSPTCPTRLRSARGSRPSSRAATRAGSTCRTRGSSTTRTSATRFTSSCRPALRSFGRHSTLRR